jgi:hypothetical protein
VSHSRDWARFGIILAAILTLTWFVLAVVREGRRPHLWDRLASIPNARFFNDTVTLLRTVAPRKKFDQRVTLLVPVDEAFKIAGIADRMGQLPTDRVLGIVSRHLILGAHTIGDLRRERFLTSSDGARLDVIATPDGVWINSARVIQGNIPAEEGIIHIIDRLNAYDVERELIRPPS